MHTLPANPTSDTLIPLAGYLLEYPISYVPISNTQTDYLAGVELDVYECFVLTTNGRHTLLKFSCPTAVGLKELAFGTESMVAKLELVYGERIESLNQGWKIEMYHERTTLDRVAL